MVVRAWQRSSAPMGSSMHHSYRRAHLPYPGGLREGGDPDCGHQAWGHCSLCCWCGGKALRYRFRLCENMLSAMILFELTLCWHYLFKVQYLGVEVLSGFTLAEGVPLCRRYDLPCTGACNSFLNGSGQQHFLRTMVWFIVWMLFRWCA